MAASVTLTAVKIPCCLCGTMILPNAANQCPTCLAQEFDLRERLQRGPGGASHSTIYQCRECRRYKRTEKHYEYAEPESPELLALCLKQIPALQHRANTGAGEKPLHLVDASWIWTEPHSMRFKLRLTVRTEVENVAVQQRVMVLLHNAFQMCSDCNREFMNRTWQAVVQLRQRRTDDAPKKGLAVLEMALQKNKEVRKHVLRIDGVKNGLDFYFLSIPHAQAFASYLQRIAPMRVKSSKKLVSADVKNNTANVKHTITCDLVPLCKDDLIVIHKSASKNKFAGRLALVTKSSSGVIHLVDASPKRENLAESQMELSADAYFKNEKYYQLLLASNRMSRFTALDVELCNGETNPSLYQGPSSGVEKYALADLEVARERDFGVNDETFAAVTHLGHLINAGDTILGYELSATVGGDWELEKSLHSHFVCPDIVLVKKLAGDPQGAKQNEDHGGKPATSKRKERRRKKEGKKMRALEERAARMGFIDVPDAEHDVAGALENDPEFAAELAALEKEFDELGSTSAGVTTEEKGGPADDDPET